MSEEVFTNIPLNNLWIFQGKEPGDLKADRAAAGVQLGTEPVVFRLSRSKPVKESSGGRISRASSLRGLSDIGLRCKRMKVERQGTSA